MCTLPNTAQLYFGQRVAHIFQIDMDTVKKAGCRRLEMLMPWTALVLFWQAGWDRKDIFQSLNLNIYYNFNPSRIPAHQCFMGGAPGFVPPSARLLLR